MGTSDYKDWSEGWLKEGHFLSFVDEERTYYYERVLRRDLGHYVYAWPEDIAALTESGPFVPDYLEVTRGYDKSNTLNRIWQTIFGIKGQAWIYIQLPTDRKRHGVPKQPWPNSTNRQVAYFDDLMSPFHEPSFLTEHFMKRYSTYRIDFTCYNPNSIVMYNDGTVIASDVKLNVYINKMVTERIGEISYGEKGIDQRPSRSQFATVLDRLHQRLIPCRPITFLPVGAPAAAPRGE